MKVAIFLRKQAASNRFRDIILDTLSDLSIDSAVLCSGFFQEDHVFSASKDFNFSWRCPNHPLELTFVGIHNSRWKPQYDRFIGTIKKNNGNNCIKIRQKTAGSYKWHAKIFIAASCNAPKLAIIGSSNITRPAFDLTYPFNFECDVLLWDPSSNINRPLETLFKKSEDRHELIITRYNKNDNGGLGIIQRLNKLWDEVESIRTKE